MKKGFTLIELLAVIVIISVVAVIAFPNLSSVLNNTEKSLNNEQIIAIENAAREFSLRNSYVTDDNKINYN